MEKEEKIKGLEYVRDCLEGNLDAVNDLLKELNKK